MSDKGKFINALFDKDTEFWAFTDKGEKVRMRILCNTMVKIEVMPFTIKKLLKAKKILDKHG